MVGTAIATAFEILFTSVLSLQYSKLFISSADLIKNTKKKLEFLFEQILKFPITRNKHDAVAVTGP